MTLAGECVHLESGWGADVLRHVRTVCGCVCGEDATDKGQPTESTDTGQPTESTVFPVWPFKEKVWWKD